MRKISRKNVEDVVPADARRADRVQHYFAFGRSMMRRVVTTQQMKEADEYTIRKMGIPSLVLMERAALACVDVLKREFPLERVLVLCGTGNNGGDGIAIGRILHLAGYDVTICLTGNDAHRSEENKTQKEIAENYGTTFVNNPDPAEYTTIVDSVFGIGLSRSFLPSTASCFKKSTRRVQKCWLWISRPAYMEILQKYWGSRACGCDGDLCICKTGPFDVSGSGFYRQAGSL